MIFKNLKELPFASLIILNPKDLVMRAMESFVLGIL